MKLVNLFELLANTQASGTPKKSAINAESMEVQRDNLIAEVSDNLLKRCDQGTLVINDKSGAIITSVAAVAKTLVTEPNFT